MPAILLFWSRAERYAPARHPPGSPRLTRPGAQRATGPPAPGNTSGCHLPGALLAEGGMQQPPSDVPARLPDFGAGHPERMLSVARE